MTCMVNVLSYVCPLRRSLISLIVVTAIQPVSYFSVPYMVMLDIYHQSILDKRKMTCGSCYLMKLPCLLCSWNTPLVHIGLFIVASHYLVGHSFLFPEVSSCQVEVDTVGLWSILPCRDPSFPLTQNIVALFTYSIYERYCFFFFFALQKSS